jgi:hypothetical protein
MSEFDNDTPRDEAGRFLGDHYRAEHARLEFTPMEDNKPRDEDNAPNYGSSDEEIRRAAAEMQERRGVQTEEAEAVVWHDRYGDPLPDNISTTKDQAAEALAKYREQKAAAAQAEQDCDLKAAIDAPRVEMAVLDEKNARLYQFDNELERAVGEFAADMGVETPATQPTVDAAPEQQPARESTPGLDPDLAKALEHPQVRAAVEQELAQAAQAQQQYAAAIDQANLYAQSSLIEHLPELARMDKSQWEGAILGMAQTNPARVQRAMSAISRVQQLSAEQARLANEHQAQRAQEIEKWSDAENARYGRWAAKEGIDVPTFAPAASRYVETHLGMSRAQFAAVLRANPALRSSEFQQVLSDAVRFRQTQEARKAIATKPLPPAPLRPGANPGTSVASNAGRIAELTQALGRASGNKAVQIAAQITSLKRRG